MDLRRSPGTDRNAYVSGPVPCRGRSGRELHTTDTTLHVQLLAPMWQEFRSLRPICHLYLYKFRRMRGHQPLQQSARNNGLELDIFAAFSSWDLPKIVFWQ